MILMMNFVKKYIINVGAPAQRPPAQRPPVPQPPVPQLTAVQTEPAAPSDTLSFVKDYPVMVGDAAPALYTGPITAGLPKGEGKLVLPGGRGLLTGTFCAGSKDENLRVAPAKLFYPNGDVLTCYRLVHSLGSFAIRSATSTYQYKNGKKARAIMKGNHAEIIPFSIYWPSPMDSVAEKLQLRQKFLADGRPTPSKALSAEENLVAWRPQTQMLTELDKIAVYAEAHNLDGRWDLQVNLVKGLLECFGPAKDYTVTDSSHLKFYHVPFEAYDSQLEHVASTMFAATAFVTIKLFDGLFAKYRMLPDVTLLFHAEIDATMRNSFRFTMLEKARCLQAAYARDQKSASGKMLTVAALLDGAFSGGPCHNGQLTAMFEILQERGALEDVMGHIPDITGEINRDVSELCLLFQKTCLNNIRDAAPKRKHYSDSKIQRLPDFEKTYTAANFTVFLQGTERGSGLSAQEIAAAVQWQIDVVGTLN